MRWQAINVEPAKMSTLAIDKARVSKTELPDADRYLVNPGLAVSASVARIRYQAIGFPELCRRGNVLGCGHCLSPLVGRSALARAQRTPAPRNSSAMPGRSPRAAWLPGGEGVNPELTSSRARIV